MKLEEIAREALDAIDSGRQITPFSQRFPSYSMDDAYATTAHMRRLREARGERVAGRKIGFTNRRIWAEYNISAPIWGYVYDRTLYELDGLRAGFPVASMAEPQIEPEIVFRLRSAPSAAMSPEQLLDTVEWVAHGFEMVQSIYPGWKFKPPDTMAANGMHGALLLGAQKRSPEPKGDWLEALSSFELDLKRGDEQIDHGNASSVLDGPLHALRHLLQLLEHDPHNPPVAAGEVITTGTLTRAFRVAAGERWSTTPTGVPLGGISVSFS